jgi:membrane dipeptidase
MVHWSSFAAITLALPLAMALQPEQIPFSQRFHQKKDALDHAHKLLRHNPLIDTHNDLPL